MPLLHFFLVTAWAVCVAIAVVVLGFGGAFSSTRAPRDIMMLAPGGTEWTPLGHEDDGQSLVDAVVLADGRLAVSAVMTSDYDEPRPCDVFDPKSRRWTRGVEIVPQRKPAPANVDVSKVERWANVGDGTTIVLGREKDGASARMEPGGVALPPLPRMPDDLAATRTADGGLVLVAAFGAEATTLRLDPGANAYRQLPAPPVPVGIEMLRPFGRSGVVAEGLDAYGVLEDGAWRTLPTLAPARFAATLVRMPDGAVVAAGGMLREDRPVVKPTALVAKVIAGIALLGLLVVAWRVLGSPTRPRVAAILAGLAVGWGAFPILALSVLKRLAWH